MFSVKQLKAGLNTQFIGNEIFYEPETDSTNEDAWQHAFLLSSEVIHKENQYREDCYHEIRRVYPAMYGPDTPKRFLCADLDDIVQYRYAIGLYSPKIVETFG